MEDEGSRMEDWGWGVAGLRPGGSTSAARTHTNATLKLFQQNCQTNATRGGVLEWEGGTARQIPRLVGCDLMQQKQAK